MYKFARIEGRGGFPKNYRKLAVHIRQGVESDIPAILTLIRELADYERALDQVEVTEETLLHDGFGHSPLFELLIAENAHAHVVGMALYYYGYSTWQGKMLYLDDLIVSYRYRRMGVGWQLMKCLAREAYKADTSQMRWHVLEWNEPAIRFYEKLQTHLDTEWVTCKWDRLQIEQLAKLNTEE